MSTLHAAAAYAAQTTTTDETSGGLFGSSSMMTWIMLGLIVVLGIFMFRSSRKRKAEAQKLQEEMKPGVEVMTSFGLFGRLVSVDELAGTAEIEVSPGNVVKVHRQTLAKVVTAADGQAPEAGAPRSVEEAMEIAEREQREREAAAKGEEDAGEPRFGERVEPTEDGSDDKGQTNR